MKFGLWSLITGKILWSGNLGNCCYGDEKNLFRALYWLILVSLPTSWVHHIFFHTFYINVDSSSCARHHIQETAKLAVSYCIHFGDTDVLLFLLLVLLLLAGTHFSIDPMITRTRQYSLTHPNALRSLLCCASARSTRLIIFSQIPLDTLTSPSTESLQHKGYFKAVDVVTSSFRYRHFSQSQGKLPRKVRESQGILFKMLPLFNFRLITLSCSSR